MSTPLSVRCFTVRSNVTFELINVTLSSGRSASGGAILNQGGTFIASDCTFSVDGNATDSFNRSHLGGYWLVHMDDGDWVYRQTDLGPAGWTGNKIDLTAGSLPAHGMSVTTPASWNNVSATYLGKDSSYAQYNGKCVGKCR